MERRRGGGMRGERMRFRRYRQIYSADYHFHAIPAISDTIRREEMRRDITTTTTSQQASDRGRQIYYTTGRHNIFTHTGLPHPNPPRRLCMDGWIDA